MAKRLEVLLVDTELVLGDIGYTFQRSVLSDVDIGGHEKVPGRNVRVRMLQYGTCLRIVFLERGIPYDH